MNIENITLNGGKNGIYIHGSGDLTVTNCRIKNSNDKGIHSYTYGNILISNTLFEGNSTGLDLEYTGKPVIWNNTFYGNGNDITARYHWANSKITQIYNCVITGEVYNGYDSGRLELYYCSIQEESDIGKNVKRMEGNIIGDPLLNDPSNGDLSLRVESKLINAGTNDIILQMLGGD